MVVIHLVGSLRTSHPHLFAIHYNHVVTHVHVRGVLRLVFAAKSMGNLGGQSAKRLVFGVDDQPIVVDVVCLGTVSFHNRSPEGGLNGARMVLESIRAFNR